MKNVSRFGYLFLILKWTNPLMWLSSDELYVSHTQLYRVWPAVKCVLCIKPIQVHTHLDQWAADAVAPGSSWGFGALLTGLTSFLPETRFKPTPWVISPTLYPLGHDCPLGVCDMTICDRGRKKMSPRSTFEEMGNIQEYRSIVLQRTFCQLQFWRHILYSGHTLHQC